MEDQVCIICNESSERGLSIWEKFICSQCEAEIIQTEVEDEKYTFFIHQLRKLWFKKEA